MPELVFTSLSLFTLACAVGVIASRNAVNGAMCLLLCLVGIAGLFVQLHAYLLAILLLLVYAGAVAALFLFIVMLLDMQGGAIVRPKLVSMAGGIVAAALLVGGLNLIALKGHLESHAPSSTEEVGSSLSPYANLLFTQYMLPVQIIGFLLLIAMIGVIVLSKRHETTETAGNGKGAA